jgi:hypothetical protein
MRKLRFMMVLALAGVAWKKLIQPRLPAAKAQLAQTRERVEPALRKVSGEVRSVSKSAVESVRDLSLSAAETAEAVRDASLAAAETADSVANAIEETDADPSVDATDGQRSATASQ